MTGGRATDAELRHGPHSGQMLMHSLRRHRDAQVLTLGDRSITGQEMADQMSRYVRALEDLGAGSGAGVGLLAANRPEVLFLIGAGQTQGYRRTALHPLGSLDDHAYVLTDAGATALIVDNVPMFLERAEALKEKVPTLTTVVTIDDLAAQAATYDASPLVAKDLDPDHVVGITYTGGTTGLPKGVIGTASSIAAMTQVQLAEWEWPEAPTFLICTPLSHAGAAFFAPTVAKGGRLVVLPRFDPAEVLRTIEAERITATMLVPSMLYALMDHPDSRTRDLSSLETVYYGAAAINPTRLAEAIDRFGPIFAQYFGQSECPMVITYLAKADHTPERLASCGRPSAFLRTALLGEDGQPVEQGQPGEICVAGPVLAGGYWNKPEETAEAFRGGWLHTGDVAREDEDGFWYIVDRIKDMIVTGGFNVFPREVEDVIGEHPAVAQVGVIGVSDDKFGEAVTAVVVLRPDEPRDDESIARVTQEIQALVKERKGSVQSPKQVVVVDSLPLTALGKPDKKALRAQF
ncbi:long-chain-fatty-acid--CoA ligase [Aeromicrobium marinum DSM 15272]|uniref:Long-chain-fatty-acid--CoA ligase n=1 Tax=Aeromicrobium marinum DSM 15272 TaxID=585531 RepID=E2SEL5_9ACTN|nr:fatty-acid--CoA ligase FadD8 [Aeromicrobium marinum]EFQ82312.1 long-chain-fatty-acid--CoA ligase [Aeromicrobium marinum DSM 15272]